MVQGCGFQCHGSRFHSFVGCRAWEMLDLCLWDSCHVKIKYKTRKQRSANLLLPVQRVSLLKRLRFRVLTCCACFRTELCVLGLVTN